MTAYTSCGFDSCADPATGYAPWPPEGYSYENRSACGYHGSDGSLLVCRCGHPQSAIRVTEKKSARV